MKIKINSEGKNFTLRLPTRLLLNRFSASLVPLFANRKLKKHGVKLKGSACRKFVKEYYRIEKNLEKDFAFVDVESSDGNIIKITV